MHAIRRRNANSCALPPTVVKSGQCTEFDWSCTRSSAQQTNKSSADLLAFQPFKSQTVSFGNGAKNKADHYRNLKPLFLAPSCIVCIKTTKAVPFKNYAKK